MIFDDKPPQVPAERKHLFLIDDNALLDMLEGYPDEHTWFLGLIFLAPSARNRGLGTRLIEAVCDHARSHGARALRLAVAKVQDCDNYLRGMAEMGRAIREG